MNTLVRTGRLPHITVSHNGETHIHTPASADWFDVETCAIAALEHASRLAGGQVQYVTSELAGDLAAAGTLWMDTGWFCNRPASALATPGDVSITFHGEPVHPPMWGSTLAASGT